MRPLLLLLAIASLVAATPAVADDDAPKNLAWDCEGLDLVSTQESIESIRLFLPERSVELPLVPSASGTRYQDDELLFWIKGGEQALLELAGEVRRCSVDARRSVWEDAKLRGLSFRAIGQEPGWVLEIGPDQLTFLYDYGTRRIDVARPEPTTDPDAESTIFTTEAQAWPFRVTLRNVECRDVMSGEGFETAVEVVWGPQLFQGCGRSLH